MKKFARDLNVGDRIVLDGVATPLRVMIQYGVHGGTQAIVTSDGVTRSFPEAFAIEVVSELVAVTREYGKVVWTVGDVQSLFDVSDEEAEDFLVANAKHIQEWMTEKGWAALKTYGEMDGLKKKEPD